MSKLAVAVLAVALAGAANAAGWRSLRIDASSEDSLAKSVATLQQELSPARRYVFDMALLDIQRGFATDEYRRRLDGLRYKEVVRLTDPTGDTAEERYRTASLRLASASPKKAPVARAYVRPLYPKPEPTKGPNGEQQRGMPAR